MGYLFTYIAEIFILIFLIITFLQSGIDKITDWKGNLEWLKGHFSKTFIKNHVPLALSLVLIGEIAVAILSVLGIFWLIVLGNGSWAMLAAIMANLVLLFLLLGQRLAKDYDGARTIVIYLIPAIFLIYLLQ